MPAAPRLKTPEQTDMIHAPRACAAWSASTTAGLGFQAAFEAGIATRSASRVASRRWDARTLVPLRASSGRSSSEHTR